MLDGQGANARGVFEGEFILEVDHVRKEFPGVVALDDVQLRIRPGSVHALMGENGAGKSTLMKIIAGIYNPDRGEVRFAGRKLDIRTPLDALNSGIAMIHQELSVAPHLTVAENIMLGIEPVSGLWLKRAAMRERARNALAALGSDIDVDAPCSTLSLSQMQILEILNMIYTFLISHNQNQILYALPSLPSYLQLYNHHFQI